MNWRGRTVEYSSDRAKRPLAEVPCADAVGAWDRCPFCTWGAVSVRGKVLSCTLSGWGLAENNPILELLSVG